VEEEIHRAISAEMGTRFDPKFFIPYIQLHEFEALAFADVAELTSVVQPISRVSAESLTEHFKSILEEATHPEAINDSYDTCPSRRISSIVPAYRKRVHGPIVTNRIGLEALRAECDHFASWLTKLEAI
jgi:hypothetical protein